MTNTLLGYINECVVMGTSGMFSEKELYIQEQASDTHFKTQYWIMVALPNINYRGADNSEMSILQK